MIYMVIRVVWNALFLDCLVAQSVCLIVKVQSSSYTWSGLVIRYFVLIGLSLVVVQGVRPS